MEAASAFDEKIYRLGSDEAQLAVLRRFARQQSDPAVRTAAVRRIMGDQTHLDGDNSHLAGDLLQ
jgi:hypothetical protein